MSNNKKIELLKSLLREKNSNYYLLPRTDKFINEFISEEDERVKWLTGFSGSFAFVIISLDLNIIFTDGRYIDQIKKEVNCKTFKIININKQDPISWLKSNVKTKEKIVLDSWLFTSKNYNLLKKEMDRVGCEIFLSNEIFIDNIWKKKIKNKSERIFVRKKKYSGDTFEKKIGIIKKIFKKKKINNFFFSSPESISWLLNIRSNKIKYTPLALCFLLINIDDKNYFFGKKNSELIKYFGRKINIFDINSLKKIFINFSILNNQIYIDPNNTPYFIENFLKSIGVDVKYEKDPCINLKLIKNSVEIKGSKSSHLRDGVSICKFLYWHDNFIKKKKKVTEILAAKKLYDLRKKNKLFFGLSFETISGYGENGSIIHYRVSKKTNKTFKNNNLYLFDSGAQYFDGTTDVTRTINIGDSVNKEHKEMFTRVLKGNISLTNFIFSKKTTGNILDEIAREYLKQINCDYPHGTGHGVGSFLSVHEGPISISKKSKTVFNEGMLITNEPGYYKTNNYGIRIENILLVVKKKNLLTFEVLTLVPIDTKLIDTKLLNLQDKKWLNNYHNKVFNKIYKFLNENEVKWLKEKTKPI